MSCGVGVYWVIPTVKGERGRIMQFMTIVTYDPDKRDDMIKRRLEKGAMASDKAKLLGEWSYLGGGKTFRVVDVEDPEAILEVALAYSDLCRIEMIPVIETETGMEVVKKQM
jgi:hypothetical protein